MPHQNIAYFSSEFNEGYSFLYYYYFLHLKVQERH